MAKPLLNVGPVLSALSSALRVVGKRGRSRPQEVQQRIVPADWIGECWRLPAICTESRQLLMALTLMQACWARFRVAFARNSLQLLGMRMVARSFCQESSMRGNWVIDDSTSCVLPLNVCSQKKTVWTARAARPASRRPGRPHITMAGVVRALAKFCVVSGSLRFGYAWRRHST